MTNDCTRLWVTSDFKKKIKSEASSKGLSVLEFTDNLANQRGSIEDFFSPKKKKERRIFDNVF